MTAVGAPPPRLYPAAPILAVSLAVFRAGKVLLATRTRAPFAGAFSLPGGGVEAGETLIEAALRELREEVAVEARVIAFNRHVESIERDEAPFRHRLLRRRLDRRRGNGGTRSRRNHLGGTIRTGAAPLHAADRRCRGERGGDPGLARLRPRAGPVRAPGFNLSQTGLECVF